VKKPEQSARLKGLGHRVYKNDPRQDRQAERRRGAQQAGRHRPAARHRHDPRGARLDRRRPRRAQALPERRLLQAAGSTGRLGPSRWFTVLFALRWLPGWIAHWREMVNDPHNKIGRPRQLHRRDQAGSCSNVAALNRRLTSGRAGREGRAQPHDRCSGPRSEVRVRRRVGGANGLNTGTLAQRMTGCTIQ
jgi:hypothetical protein